jgi:hypothetical protein
MKPSIGNGLGNLSLDLASGFVASESNPLSEFTFIHAQLG